MSQFGGKDSKRHFTVVMGNKEHGLYISSTPSSAAKKVVTKLCSANKSKKVEFHIREITQGSKKKIYGPYTGHIEKLKEPIELKGRIIKYKPFVKLIKKKNLEKRKMKGGGYASTLEVNKDISIIIRYNLYNLDPTLVFTVTNVATSERKEYRNIHYLGKGTYGKVFLVENDGKRYVIKLLSNYINNSLKEAKLLNSFMNGISNKCKYKSISQGQNKINRYTIGHIIFPFKGDTDLKKIIESSSTYNIIPKILSDIISCLIDINKFACHLDLKLDNIVYDDTIKTAFIIDYGLSMLFPIDINEVVIGNRQISVDIIMCLLIKVDKFSELYTSSSRASSSNNSASSRASSSPNSASYSNFASYSNSASASNSASSPNSASVPVSAPVPEYLSMIQSTIDNFGLFWIIIESITSEVTAIFNKYLYAGEFLFKSRNIQLLLNYVNFYFNLDNTSPTKLTTKLTEEINKYKNKFTGVDLIIKDPNLRQNFIADVRSKISSVKFDFYFKTEENYNQFMEKVLGLVRFDPRTRIPKEELLQDAFFAIRDNP